MGVAGHHQSSLDGMLRRAAGYLKHYQQAVTGLVD
jgi:hypothetical protein